MNKVYESVWQWNYHLTKINAFKGDSPVITIELRDAKGEPIELSENKDYYFGAKLFSASDYWIEPIACTIDDEALLIDFDGKLLQEGNGEFEIIEVDGDKKLVLVRGRMNVRKNLIELSDLS